MRTLKFKNNDEMPALGLGTWKSSPEEVYNAVKTAIKAGYRHIDCAPIYGNEEAVGQALTDCIAEGVVSRASMWITSKLWNDSHARADVIPALRKTLSDLQTDYLDLFLIHWPVALKKDIPALRSAEDMISLDEMPLSETWQGMEEAVDSGLARHIGVSNFGKKNLAHIIANSRIRPEMNQVELHPYLQQEALLSFCKANGIFLTAYAPLGSPDRVEALKAKNEPKLLENSIIGDIARAKNATPGQILISWALHRGVSAIPKSVNPERIVQNFQAEQIRLSDDDMKAIAALEKHMRYVSGAFWVFEDGPYTLEGIWA